MIDKTRDNDSPERKFNTKLRPVGNSLGIIIPKKILDEKNIKEGDEITIQINIQELQNAKRIQRILSARGSMKRRFGSDDAWDYNTEDFEESDKQEHK